MRTLPRHLSKREKTLFWLIILTVFMCVTISAIAQVTKPSFNDLKATNGLLIGCSEVAHSYPQRSNLAILADYTEINIKLSMLANGQQTNDFYKLIPFVSCDVFQHYLAKEQNGEYHGIPIKVLHAPPLPGILSFFFKDKAWQVQTDNNVIVSYADQAKKIEYFYLIKSLLYWLVFGLALWWLK